MKKDWDTFTGGVKQGIEDLTQGKRDVEEIGNATDELYDQPRYDSAWVTEVQQRLMAAGLNRGPSTTEPRTHISRRNIFKQNRSVALAEWRQLAA